MDQKIYKAIKRQNGEKFARQIRDYNSRIFSIPNLLYMVQYAGRDAETILPVLNYFVRQIPKKVQEDKTPYELLKEAGYNAFYADTLKKQNSIQKYFAKSEELCTFKDAQRYLNYHIIHCVKENVDEIKRENFPHPERQDAYGTSVISIQISKRGGFIRITNRYNHTIESPDNTFDSNPDNIIEGLSSALEKHFNVSIEQGHVSMPNGFIFANGQILKVNYEWRAIYLGDGFFSYNGKVIPLQTDYQFFAGPYLFDLKRKKVQHFYYRDESFAKILTQEMTDKSVQLRKENEEKVLLLNGKEFLVLDKQSRFKNLTLLRTKYLPDETFEYETGLKKFVAPELETLGDFCFFSASALEEVHMPNLRHMGEKCFGSTGTIDSLVFEKLKSMGRGCFCLTGAKELVLPKLRIISASSIRECPNLERIYAPSVVEIQDRSIVSNSALRELFLPNCQSIKCLSIQKNQELTRLDLLRVKVIGYSSIKHNFSLKSVYAPKLKEVYDEAISYNSTSTYVEAPNLVLIKGKAFCCIDHLYAPYLRINKRNFLPLNYFCLRHKQFVKKGERFYNLFGLLNWYRSKQWGR